MLKDKNQLLISLFFVSILGIIVSGYLTYLHYTPEDSTFCNISESLNCDLVNKSQYSTLDGFFNWLLPGAYLNIPIPNALLSTLLFISISVISLLILKEIISKETEKDLIETLLFIMWLGILYSTWLVYIEAFVLRTWCIFCILLDVIIVITTILLFNLKRINRNNHKSSVSFPKDFKR